MDSFSPSYSNNSMISENPIMNIIIIRLSQHISRISDENPMRIIIEIRSSINSDNNGTIFKNFLFHSFFIGTTIISFTNISIIINFINFLWCTFGSAVIIICSVRGTFFAEESLFFSVFGHQIRITSITTLIIHRTS